jgi:hypothetical protein
MEIAPNPDLLAATVERVEQVVSEQPAFARRATVDSYILGQYAGLFVRAARDHGSRCAGCELCTSLSEGLTLISAYHVFSPELAVHDIWGQRP